ncbi:MAG: oligosaccharide flippase family protein [Candidatus Sumerlaeia bacterium]|nr:oligosaccharide flippase family protein [Candidatus Sumerlaeia bacterium]
MNSNINNNAEGPSDSVAARRRGWRRLLNHIPLHLVASRTGREAALVVFGNFVNKVLVFVLHSLLIRTLDKASFAVFSVTVITTEILTELADLGLNVNLVRTYSRHAERNPAAALSVVRLILRIKVLWVFVLTLAFYMLAPSFAGLLRRPDLTEFFRLAAVGLAGPVMIYFALAHLQAARLFGRYVLINVLERLALVVLIVLLAATGRLWLYPALLVWIGVPFLAAILAFLAAPRDYWRSGRIEPGVAAEVFHFGKWALLLVLIVLLMYRLEVFMLTALANEEEVADFVIALRLCALFQVVTTGITTALVPRVGRFDSADECRSYLKLVLRISPLVLAATGAVCLFAYPLMVWPFGEKAAPAVPVFRVLALGETAWMFVGFMVPVYYRLNRVDLLCATNALTLVVSAASNWFLVPHYLGMGAAVAYVAARTALLIAVLFLLPVVLRKPPTSASPGTQAVSLGSMD